MKRRIENLNEATLDELCNEHDRVASLGGHEAVFSPAQIEYLNDLDDEIETRDSGILNRVEPHITF